MAAHQDLTREWWDTRSDEFELYASAVVVEEAQDGDATAAAARLEVIFKLTLLECDAGSSRSGCNSAARNAVAAKSQRRCSAYRHRNGGWHGLPDYMELQAHRECNYTSDS